MTALVLQALLLSLTPPAASAAAAIQSLAATAICRGSPTGPGDPAAPAPAHDHHPDHACCILCTVPGLAASATPVVLAAPVWIGPIIVTAARGRVFRLAQPFERSPVRPRAPPA